MFNENDTYSIQIRVQRIISEDAYVAVPVTDTIMNSTSHEDGTFRIDSDKLIAEALRISNDARVEWRFETCHTQAHPIQQPLPQDRRSFDAFYAQDGQTHG
jgi:hypothetical protein